MLAVNVQPFVSLSQMLTKYTTCRCVLHFSLRPLPLHVFPSLPPWSELVTALSPLEQTSQYYKLLRRHWNNWYHWSLDHCKAALTSVYKLPYFIAVWPRLLWGAWHYLLLSCGDKRKLQFASHSIMNANVQFFSTMLISIIFHRIFYDLQNSIKTFNLHCMLSILLFIVIINIITIDIRKKLGLSC